MIEAELQGLLEGVNMAREKFLTSKLWIEGDSLYKCLLPTPYVVTHRSWTFYHYCKLAQAGEHLTSIGKEIPGDWLAGKATEGMARSVWLHSFLMSCENFVIKMSLLCTLRESFK